MQRGMLMNGSSGAVSQDRAKQRLMAKILQIAGQTLAALAWCGISGEYSVVLNLKASSLTHVRTLSTIRGKAGRFRQERHRWALEAIERAVAAAMARLPESGFFGTVTIRFTHANGTIAYEETTFENVRQIND